MVSSFITCRLYWTAYKRASWPDTKKKEDILIRVKDPQTQVMQSMIQSGEQRPWPKWKRKILEPTVEHRNRPTTSDGIPFRFLPRFCRVLSLGAYTFGKPRHKRRGKRENLIMAT
jgi:hypothetical protein